MDDDQPLGYRDWITFCAMLSVVVLTFALAAIVAGP
jgi:hypothetical protein